MRKAARKRREQAANGMQEWLLLPYQQRKVPRHYKQNGGKRRTPTGTPNNRDSRGTTPTGNK